MGSFRICRELWVPQPCKFPQGKGRRMLLQRRKGSCGIGGATMNRVHGFSLVESSSRMEGKEPFFSLLGSAVVTACVRSPFWCFSRFMFVNFSQMLYKIEGSFGLPWWLRWLSVCLQCRRPGSNPWSGRFPGEENGNPLQYSCLENPMDRGAW